MRENIWNLLCDLKFKGFILGYLVDKNQKRDRNINIFLAIASSTSIAAWAIWQKYPFLWSGIIATSQILTVIKPYIPYFKYAQELNKKSLTIDNINIEIEKLWFYLQSNKISEDVAAEEYFIIKQKLTEILNFGDDTIFKVTKKMKNKANQRVKNYIKLNYGVETIITKTKN